jgi:uncharacterized protein
VNGCLVSNTGPIVALAVIDRLVILRALFSQVVVSEFVHRELLQGGAEGLGLSSYQQASWIEVRALVNPLDALLATVLHQGEASVIQLARELGAAAVLVDERKARKLARTIYGIRVIGTARVLVDAKRSGLLGNVGDALAGIRSAGYWIHDDIVSFARREAGEE